MKLWKFSAFDAETLVFRKMPVEDIHLDGFHAVEVALEDVERNEMAADVDHESAPCETRLVLNGDGRSGETVRRYFDELEKCLQSAEHAERICGVELCAGRSDFERVGFVLAEFLNFFAGVVGVNHQRRLRSIASGLWEE